MKRRPRQDSTSVETFFEPGLLDRLQLQYGSRTPVRQWAEWALDFCRRKVVQNPDGLLVTKVREEAARATGGALSPAEQQAEGLRYAELHLTIYRAVSEQQLSPAAIARLLEDARRNGFARLNTAVIEKLSFMGEQWPAPPALDEPRAAGDAA